jgi:hypothetical protein
MEKLDSQEQPSERKPPAPEHGKTSVSLYIFVIIVIWTIFIGALLWFNVDKTYKTAEESALLQARTAYEKDVVYRRWVSGLGGVYGKVSDTLPPNPYLADDGTRDIAGPNGVLYTKINPAYMTRLVHELGELNSGVIGHITSTIPSARKTRPTSGRGPRSAGWRGTGALRKFSRYRQSTGRSICALWAPWRWRKAV